MIRGALALRLFLALASFLTLCSGAQAALTQQPAAAAGRCTGEHVKDLFPEPAQPRPELCVLVTSFYGADNSARVLGHNVGRHMRTVLESHAREEIKSDYTGLHADAIRVKFVPCTLDDHEHARQIGKNAQADVHPQRRPSPFCIKCIGSTDGERVLVHGARVPKLIGSEVAIDQ